MCVEEEPTEYADMAMMLMALAHTHTSEKVKR